MNQSKVYLIYCTLLLCFFFARPTSAGVHYVGAYIGAGQGQDIFIRDCNKFRAQFPATVGTHYYRNWQYAYAYKYQFEGSNDANVD